MTHFKKLLPLILIAVCIVAKAQNPRRIKYNFNSEWKLFVGDNPAASASGFDDQSWKPVTLPHAWNEDEAFNKDIHQLSTGIAWYRKHFKIPASDAGKKVFIEFEGLRMAGDVYLNGKLLGTHENGVMAFGFDITDAIKPNEENVIAVRTDNAWNYKEKATGSTFQWNDGNFNANYGGINKNVWLHVTDKLYQTFPLYSFLNTTGTYIYAKNYDIPKKTATVFVESQIKNDYATKQNVVLRAIIKDREGKVVKTITSAPNVLQPGEMKTVTISGGMQGLNFWSWGYGYLYTVTTSLLVNGQAKDQLATVTGFRKTAFENGVTYLNDRGMMVHGFAQRTTNEWPAVGMSVPAWMSDYSNGMQVEGNGNVVRWMHITPWKQDIESCDRVGLIQAMPAGDAEHDTEGRKWELRTFLMRDAIIYNRNNPSIIFYESGNESITADHMRQMKAIRDKYDPYGGRAIGSREMLDIPDAEYGGEMLYVNKSATKPLWNMEYARDEALRKLWDDYTPPYHKNGDAGGKLYKGTSTADYNKNQDVFALDAVKQWYAYWVDRPGTGTRVSDGGVSIMFSESNTFTRSVYTYRTSGKTDAMRLPKDAFYANQIMWDGWVDANPKGIHILGHWNYEAGVKKDEYVISAGDKVELFLNGKSLGFGEQSDRFIFTFKNVEFQPGILKAVSYTANGQKLSEATLSTAGKPYALRLKAINNPTGFHADGADMAMADVEVVDDKGNRCPTALNMINFNMTGPAEWRGGIADGPNNYILAKSLPVQCGINRVMFRSTTTAGKITLTATSDGLKPATVTYETIPVTVKDGLTKWLPSDGLKSSYVKGPTPAGPSFKVIRKSLTIKSAIAGSNNDKVKNSYDDNELSDWVSDGTLANAWIKYTLEKPSTISAVGMKLNNFRSRSYSLIIKVDDKVVFDGYSKTGLGYYTQDFKPVVGSTVTLQLSPKAASKQGNGTDIGVEVTGKKLDDGVARDDINAKGTLSVIEADIFQ